MFPDFQIVGRAQEDAGEVSDGEHAAAGLLEDEFVVRVDAGWGEEGGGDEGVEDEVLGYEIVDGAGEGNDGIEPCEEEAIEVWDYAGCHGGGVLIWCGGVGEVVGGYVRLALCAEGRRLYKTSSRGVLCGCASIRASSCKCLSG